MHSYFKKILVLTFLTISATTYCAEKSAESLYPEWLQELSQEIGTLYDSEQLSGSEKEQKINSALQETFLDAIITDSNKAALYNEKAFADYVRAVKKPGTVLQTIYTLADAYQKKCPLLFLNECNGAECLLSRCCNPTSRKKFEDEAAQELFNKLQTTQKKEVHYCGFGSGRMLLDCFIITKALYEQKLKCKVPSKLTIHLLDSSYETYVKMRDKKTKHRKIDTSYNLKDIFKSSSSTQKTQESALQHMNFHHEFLYQQFISFLQTHFSEAEPSLFIHDSTDSYLGYCVEREMQFPDIIIAADIVSAQDIEKKPLENYEKLYEITSEYNLQCTTLLLTVANFNTKHSMPLLVKNFETPTEAV